MDRKASSKNKKIKVYNMGEVFMEIKLNERELMVVLDSLVEALAFDNDADDIRDVYNRIIKQTNIDKYEILE